MPAATESNAPKERGVLTLHAALTWFAILAAGGAGGAGCAAIAEAFSVVHNAQPIPAFDAPAIDDDTTVAWIAVGDTGEGSSRQHAVARGMARVADEYGADFVTLLGDNFYPNGVSSADDDRWRSAFRDVYTQTELDVPFYAILGNHDYHGAPEVQVGWAGDGRWNMPARYYTFERAFGAGESVQFFMLDTGPLSARADSAAVQLRWLEEQLAGSRARWKIVCGHHTLHSAGKHGNNEVLIETLQPLLLQHGVDLYLNGHDHHLAMMVPSCGLPVVVSGAGCKTRSVTWTEETAFAAAEPGFARVLLAGEELTVSFHDRDGDLLFSWLSTASADTESGQNPTPIVHPRDRPER